MKGICGVQPVKAGGIRYAGENITGKPPHRLVRRGLAMVPEGRGVFGAPTYAVGDELFWGQDRLDFVARKLAK